MKRYGLAAGVACFFALAASASAQGLRHEYVGKSSCAVGIKGTGAGYSARLDKTQNAYLEARTLSHSKILLITQYETGDLKCGIVRDLIQIRDLSKGFDFSCFSRRSPSDVVVGTMKEDEGRERWIPAEAWQINLKELTFEKARESVSCINENYAGSDDGSDLVDAAKKHAMQVTMEHRQHASP